MCCLTYAEAKAKIEAIAKLHHPNDYKVFVAHRQSDGVELVRKLGLVVKPDDAKNDTMFKAFVELKASTATDCIKILHSQVDVRDGRLIDLFLFEITTGD